MENKVSWSAHIHSLDLTHTECAAWIRLFGADVDCLGSTEVLQVADSCVGKFSHPGRWKGQSRRCCFMCFFFLQNTQIGLAVALLCPVYSSHLSKHTNKPAALPPNAQHTWLIFYFFFFLPQLTEEVMQGVKSAGLRRRFLWVCVSTLLYCQCWLMAKLGIAIIGRLIK